MTYPLWSIIVSFVVVLGFIYSLQNPYFLREWFQKIRR